MVKTVLVVDDDPRFLGELLSVLTAEGYSTVAATNGREAMAALNNPHAVFDAAIIDLALPETGGFQIIGQLATTQKEAIPLIAITGAYSDLYLEVAKYLGARVSIRKPEPGQSLTPIIEAMKQVLSAKKDNAGAD